MMDFMRNSTKTHKRSPIKVRFDKNAVALFDSRNGTKLRFAIGKYEKASKPELVDLKITDYCSFNCSFCYQGSSVLGKHAKMENVDFVINELAKAKVFEVAIGGGDPLEYDDIVEVLQKFHAAGIVPNFTTKFPGKLRKIWPEIEHIVGGFAYSAETPGQIRAAASLFTKGGIPLSKANLHYVMGLGDREHFRNYLEAANEVGLRVTLLGYKTSGRGKDVVPFPYDWWMEEVTDLVSRGVCPSLSIDTPLAEAYADELPVDHTHFHTLEGAFSLYIDMVSMEMGASSFDEKEELVPFDSNWRKLYKQRSFAKGQWGNRLS